MKYYRTVTQRGVDWLTYSTSIIILSSKT